MGEVADNYEQIQDRVAAAALRAGRSPDLIRIMAVTKTQSRARIAEAYEAGIRLYGENRIGEAEEKYRDFHQDVELHMIGHLQRNKASLAVGLVSCVQSVDKIETARVLDRLCASRESVIEVMLEVNTSGEATKSGYTEREAVLRDLDVIVGLKNIKVTGLMTIAPFVDDLAAVRASFRALFTLREEITRRFPNISLRELSMGMSGDFEIAVEEGSTLVRIGTALFGRREAA